MGQIMADPDFQGDRTMHDVSSQQARVSRIGLSVLAAIIVLIPSCAPVVKYRELRPGHLNLGKDPSFVLDKVDIPTDFSGTDCGIKKSKKKGFWNGVADILIDVVENGLDSAALKVELETAMRSEIAQNEFATYSSSEAAYRMNLSGSLWARDSSEEISADKDAKGDSKKSVQITRSYRLGLKYDIIANTKAGLVAARKQDLDWAFKAEAGTKEDALSQLDDCYSVGTKMIGDAVRRILRDILPHYVMVMRRLREGARPEIAAAAKVAAAGDLDRAKDMWIRVLQSDAGLSAKDKAAIHHDLGVYYESGDRTTEAKSEFEQCDRDFKDEWCAQGLARLEERTLKLEELRRDGIAAVAPPTGLGPHAQEPSPGEVRVSTGQAGIEWVLIPGGSFKMGSAEEDLARSKPAHKVAVRAFELAKTEVTNKQYQACVAAGACAPAHSSDGTCYVYDGSTWNQGKLSASAQGDDLPVVCVDWDQAKAFSRWAGGRLPSEAEWEYAARSAGQDSPYPWGNEDVTCKRAVIRRRSGDGCGRKAAWVVCSKPSGNTQQGLCDLAGNVSEWTQDWFHDSYKGAPVDGSAWESPAGTGRVVRGGSWLSSEGDARAANRDSYEPSHRSVGLGFRPLRERMDLDGGGLGPAGRPAER
jgi:formylglycine-generating enzyme required for sulfatase activity